MRLWNKVTGVDGNTIRGFALKDISQRSISVCQRHPHILDMRSQRNKTTDTHLWFKIFFREISLFSEKQFTSYLRWQNVEVN